jgi:ubiquinone/menaquinone biosynthesis C-methylase UbiE
MSHVDYSEWSLYLEKIIRRHRIPHNVVLELAAGTCQMALTLNLKSKLRVHSDLVPQMLESAGDGFPYSRAACDMKRLPFKTGVDLIFCCYDSFNYMRTPEQALSMLKECYRVLNPGGFLIFDISTRYNSLCYFSDATDYEEVGGSEIVRRSWFDEKRSEQHNLFVIFTPDSEDRYVRSSEHHIQKIWEPEDIEKWLLECNFETEACYSGFGFREPGSRAERIHYIVKKL